MSLTARLARTSTAVAAVGVLLAAPTPTVGGPARAAAATEACDEALNPDRRSVYRFRNDGRTLGFGRVVVTATAADPDRYCIRVAFGGRTVTHRYDQGSYLRVDGKWKWEGGLGTGAYRTDAYEQTLEVRKGQRVNRTYGVRSGGRWYETVGLSRTNL